jgi:XTP/dITP diphosphohydrolase
MTILFGTQNYGKAKEVKDLFKEIGIEVLTFTGIEDIPNVIEDGDTFEVNAKKKATAFYEAFRIPVFTDDSGLAVDQLNGEPGVYSARYAGENATDDENNNKLLLNLKNHPAPHSARFVCCAVYYDGKKFISSHGTIEGEITNSPQGKNGFGYDPLFKPIGYDKTTAELELNEKNKISHRAKAFIALSNELLKGNK